MILKRAGNASGDDASEGDRNGIADLPHALGPGAGKDVPVGESLEASALADGEVAECTIGGYEHIFAPGNAVTTGLECFAGPVELTARVAGVSAGARLKFVVGDSQGFRGLRIGEADKGISHGAPAGREREGFNAGEGALDSGWRRRAAGTWDVVFIPVCSIEPLGGVKGVLGM